MKTLRRSLLPAIIAATLALSASVAPAQEGEQVAPGLYITTDEGKTYLQQGDEILEMEAGESGFANDEGMERITRLPRALDWPCSGTVAMGRRFATYSLEDLQSRDRAGEIAARYFDVPEVIEPIPNWIDGEFHEIFSIDELLKFSSPEYWYSPSTNREFLDPKRPKALLVSMYVGITTAIVDNNALDILRELHSDSTIPVVFVFNDTNTVPISYFGENVSLEEVSKAFNERGIKVADVPMWWLGDYHLTPTVEEFEKYFEIPALSEIDNEVQDKLREDLALHGFSRKPIIVNLFAETATMAVDQPARVRVAADMGIRRIPTVLQFYERDSIVARCGPGTPVGFGQAAISGETTPEPGGAVLPGSSVSPPPPDPEDPTSGF